MRFLAALLLAPALMLGACATASFETKATASDARINGAHIYIYSFLDIRNHDFGINMINEVNQQLQARLTERGVTTQLVTYADVADEKALGGGSIAVPVPQIVEANRAQEQAMGATYRLIVFPREMSLVGDSQHYDVEWRLVDVSNDNVEWTSTLEGDRTVWWNQNEDARGRARTFVDGVIAQMVSSGLLNGAATPAAAI